VRDRERTERSEQRGVSERLRVLLLTCCETGAPERPTTPWFLDGYATTCTRNEKGERSADLNSRSELKNKELKI
jgi:hypothetical protein